MCTCVCVGGGGSSLRVLQQNVRCAMCCAGAGQRGGGGPACESDRLPRGLGTLCAQGPIGRLAALLPESTLAAGCALKVPWGAGSRVCGAGLCAVRGARAVWGGVAYLELREHGAVHHGHLG